MPISWAMASKPKIQWTQHVSASFRKTSQVVEHYDATWALRDQAAETFSSRASRQGNAWCEGTNYERNSRSPVLQDYSLDYVWLPHYVGGQSGSKLPR